MIYLERKIVLNSKYKVLTKWDTWEEGIVCAKRHYFVENENNTTSYPNSEFSHEYFVHYLNYDKRFDDWVTIDKIDLTTYKCPYEDNGDLNGFAKDLSSATILTRDQFKKFTNNIHQTPENSNHSLPPNKKLKNGNEHINDVLEKEFKEFTKVKYITKIQLGPYIIDTWYFSPYPNAFGKCRMLYICHLCLKYFALQSDLLGHVRTCQNFPFTADDKKNGMNCRLIYKKNKLLVYEIDGAKNKFYCQCLCLLGKLFIDQKTVYYDVESFLFYVLFSTTNSLSNKKQNITHIAGYFSKEKDSEENNNIACIVIFPPFQGFGYGNFLIQISYELSRRRGLIAQPEKPLSYLGLKAYETYWAWKIGDYLLQTISTYNSSTSCTLAIQNLCKHTGINREDVLTTLEKMDLLNCWDTEPENTKDNSDNSWHTVCITQAQILNLENRDKIKVNAEKSDKIRKNKIIKTTNISENNLHNNEINGKKLNSSQKIPPLRYKKPRIIVKSTDIFK